jgi:hypothetical protein
MGAALIACAIREAWKLGQCAKHATLQWKYDDQIIIPDIAKSGLYGWLAAAAIMFAKLTEG